MSSLYANTGCDLDLILFTGTGPGSLYIYDDTGQDLGERYVKGSVGYDLGFVAPSGQDIGRILGGDLVAIWRSTKQAMPYKTYASDCISTSWGLVDKFSSTKDGWSRITADSEELEIGQHQHVSRSYYYNYPWSYYGPYYGSYAFHVVAHATDAEIEVSLGSPSSGDGKVWIDEIRSPNPTTKNFVVVGLGGTNITWTVHQEPNATDHMDKSWICNTVWSYVTLYIKLKIGGTVARTYAAKLKF